MNDAELLVWCRWVGALYKAVAATERLEISATSFKSASEWQSAANVC